MHSSTVRGTSKRLHSSSDVLLGLLIDTPSSSSPDEFWGSFWGDQDQSDDDMRFVVHVNFPEEFLEALMLFQWHGIV